MIGHQFKNGKVIQHLVTNQDALQQQLPEFEFYRLHRVLEDVHVHSTETTGYLVIDCEEPYAEEIMSIIDRYEKKKEGKQS